MRIVITSDRVHSDFFWFNADCKRVVKTPTAAKSFPCVLNANLNYVGFIKWLSN